MTIRDNEIPFFFVPLFKTMDNLREGSAGAQALGTKGKIISTRLSPIAFWRKS